MAGMLGVDQTEYRGPAAYLPIIGQHASSPFVMLTSANDGTRQGRCMGPVLSQEAGKTGGCQQWPMPGLKMCWISRHEPLLPPYRGITAKDH